MAPALEATAAATIGLPPAAWAAWSTGFWGRSANQLGHSTTATAIRMASVANDIPASGPKPLGGCQAFVTVLPPHGKESDASHAVHPDALIEETFAFDFAIVWVHGPED